MNKMNVRDYFNKSNFSGKYYKRNDRKNVVPFTNFIDPN